MRHPSALSMSSAINERNKQHQYDFCSLTNTQSPLPNDLLEHLLQNPNSASHCFAEAISQRRYDLLFKILKNKRPNTLYQHFCGLDNYHDYAPYFMGPKLSKSALLSVLKKTTQAEQAQLIENHVHWRGIPKQNRSELGLNTQLCDIHIGEQIRNATLSCQVHLVVKKIPDNALQLLTHFIRQIDIELMVHLNKLSAQRLGIDKQLGIDSRLGMDAKPACLSMNNFY